MVRILDRRLLGPVKTIMGGQTTGSASGGGGGGGSITISNNVDSENAIKIIKFRHSKEVLSDYERSEVGNRKAQHEHYALWIGCNVIRYKKVDTCTTSLKRSCEPEQETARTNKIDGFRK